MNEKYMSHRMLMYSVISLIVLVAILFASSGIGRAVASIDQKNLIGRFEISWGDSKGAQARTEYYLYTVQGDIIRLEISDPLPLPSEELIGLRGLPVVVEGVMVGDSQSTSAKFVVRTLRPVEGALAQTEAVTGSQPWVSILCKFSDVSSEPKSPFYFQDMYRSTYPGMDHYWREQSFDLMNIVGSRATSTWYVLPQPRSYYVYDMDNDGQVEFDFTRATNDCTAVANPEINYATFVGINMMFNSDLDGYAWGGSRYLTLDGVSKVWYTTWEPPWGYDDITVIAHEMGHGFGLPHSSGEYGQTYDNQWDVMSDTWTNCGRLTDATFGCLGQHTNSYHKDREGWLGGKQVNVSLYSQVTITLEQLSIPQTANTLMVKVPINGSSSLYYTVEARRNSGTGYDIKLPGSAVIIHEINTGRSIPAHVKDVDGNGNTGDSGAQWLPGETFTDAANQITITVNSSTATGFVVTVCNACNAPTPTPTQTPSPTIPPTPTATPAAMHVGDLDNTSTSSGSKWTAKVLVTVHGAAENPLAGVLVNGSWSNGAKGTGSCTTDSSGKCTISKANLSSKTTSVVFTVTNLTKTGYTYSSTSNHDPDGDSNGTKITVNKK